MSRSQSIVSNDPLAFQRVTLFSIFGAARLRAYGLLLAFGSGVEPDARLQQGGCQG